MSLRRWFKRAVVKVRTKVDPANQLKVEFEAMAGEIAILRNAQEGERLTRRLARMRALVGELINW